MVLAGVNSSFAPSTPQRLSQATCNWVHGSILMSEVATHHLEEPWRTVICTC